MTPPAPRRRILSRLLSTLASLAAVAAIGAATVTGVGLLEERAAATPAAEASPPMPVETVTWRRQEGYAEAVTFLGRVEARRNVDLALEETGRLIAIHAEEGELVAAGAPLAVLDAALPVASRVASVAARDRAAADLALARITEERQKRLVAEGHVPEQRLDEARYAREALEAQVAALEAEIAALDIRIARHVVVAPFGGVVTARMMDEGVVAAAGAPVLRLREAGAPQARIGVAPDVAGRFVPGQSYDVEVGGAPVAAVLRAAIPDLDAATRSVALIFDLPPDLGAADGATVTLAAELEMPGRGGWLPVSALREGERGLWSVLAVEGGRAVREAVQVVALAGERAFVDGTLADGAEVIAAGTGRIAPGQPVAAKPVEGR